MCVLLLVPCHFFYLMIWENKMYGFGTTLGCWIMTELLIWGEISLDILLSECWNVSCSRQPTQDAPEEVRARDFRRELEERERTVVKSRDRGARGKRKCVVAFFFFLSVGSRNLFKNRGYFCPLEHTTSSSSSSSKRPRLDQIPAANLDADDPLTDVCTKNIFFNVFLIIWLLKSVCFGVGGWRLRLRFWQWWWHRCPAGWTREDQERESWGTGEEGESCWSLLAN